MKTLLLIRHAKSNWGNPDVLDHDRPLSDRGRRDAPEMGRRLQARGVRPGAILSSTALRARTTAVMIAEALGFDPERIVTERDFYAAAPKKLSNTVRALDDDLTCVVLVGHNPEMTELARKFSKEIAHMPTCGVAAFDFNVSAWSQLGDVAPASVLFDYPNKDAD